MGEDIVKKQAEEVEIVQAPSREDIMLSIVEIIGYLKDRLQNGRITEVQNEKIRLENVRLQLKGLKDLNEVIGASENSGLYSLLREIKEQQAQKQEVVENTQNEEKLNKVLEQLIEMNKED